MTLAHPAAALVALVGLVPLAVTLVRGRAARRARAELGLAPPALPARLARPLALACAFALLGLAAAQPSLSGRDGRAVRTDAQLLVVLDNSRSMLAAPSRGAQPRYRRAAALARRLHAALPDVAAGVASLSNRLLPYLFPTADDRAFDRVLAHAYAVERPPPAYDVDRRLTSFEPLGQAAAHGFFSPGVRRRLLVVISDAETRAFDARETLSRLERGGATPVVVRVWRRDERIFRADGGVEDYRPAQPDETARLRAAGWQAYPERDLAGAVRAVRRALGSGPVARAGSRGRETPLAPALALAALGPLLLVLAPAGGLPPLPRRRRTAGGLRARALADR